MLQIKLAFKNVLAYWKHSASSIFAVASGVISICLFQGYVNNLSSLFHESISKVKMLGDVVIENKNVYTLDGKRNPFKYHLDEFEQEKFKKIFETNPDLVSNYVSFLNISGMISNGPKNTIFLGYGYSIKTGEQMRTLKYKWNTYFGIPLNESNTDSLVIGGGLAKLLDCKFDNKQEFMGTKTFLIEQERSFLCRSNLVQLSANTVHDQLNATSLNIVGIVDANYREIDNKFLQTSLENSQILMDTKGISYFGVKLKNKNDFSQFIQVLKKSLGNNFDKYTITKWENHQFGDIYNRNMQLFALFRNFVLSIIVFVCGFSVFNTMLKIVIERHREIGTLRSFGFSRNQILTMFLAEGFLISFIGIVLGHLFSFIFTSVINNSNLLYRAGMLTRPVLFNIDPSFKLYLGSGIVMIIISMIATYWALVNVQKKKIVECLSYA